MTGHGPTTRRPPRRVVAVLAVAIVVELVLGVGVSSWLVVDRPSAAVPPRAPAAAAPTHQARAAGGLPGSAITPAEPDPARTTAVRALLAARSTAVLRRDKSAFLAGIDPRSPAFRAAQARLFDSLADVPLRAWRYQLDPAREQPVAALTAMRRYGTDPVWVPQLELDYALAGFDHSQTAQQQYLTFVQRRGHWYIAADSDLAAAGEDTARNLWDFGPVDVLRTSRSLVLGHPADLATMRAVIPVTDAAVPRVTAVWGPDWAQQVVVLVPSTQRELSRVLANGSDLSQIAAVATADLAGTEGRPAGERIIVNPPNYGMLGPLGRRVVLTHEITHVASRAVTSAATPSWLAEGFADYVGYLGTGVSVAAAAAELGEDVRARRLPAALPADIAFDGTDAALAQAYEQAWLACRLIAERAGAAGLVRFYRQVGDSGQTPEVAVAAALGALLHLSTAQFTAQWRGYLTTQLG